MIGRAIALLALVLPAALAAQARVVGVVRDSLAGRPLANATVQLVPQSSPELAPRAVFSDSAGRFAIADVLPGRYLIGFLHPRLDTLGMEAPVRVLDVTGRAPEVGIDLALPGAATIAAAICGATRDTTGLLLGRVLDAERGHAIAQGAVDVRWAELLLSRDGLQRVTRSVRAPLGDGGRYAACGVPTDVPVAVQAFAGTGPRPGATSGEVELTFPPATPLLRRDFLIAVARAQATPTDSTVAAAPDTTRRGTARVAGRVTRPGGRPIAGARVFVRDARTPDSMTVTRADGQYRIDSLPAGTYQIEAIAIGFTPARGVVDLRPDSAAAVDLALGAQVKTLEKVTVYAAPIRQDSEFAQRMKMGFGRYLTAEQVARRAGSFVSDVLIGVPGLRTAGTVRGRPVIVGRAGCSPALYLNGFEIRDGLSEIDFYVRPGDVGGIEVYPDGISAPVQYSRGSCGAVLVWTKEALW